MINGDNGKGSESDNDNGSSGDNAKGSASATIATTIATPHCNTCFTASWAEQLCLTPVARIWRPAAEDRKEQEVRTKKNNRDRQVGP
ncbi:hypothetical protein E2562_033504 [Oryza meyeriana var. granulata]|uniref:Uncharacterized protein n=1 Tax=Oryza meyeriana var. granulata TaxID=110450 RepID=A0A6G1ED40_9ORYZ|nr:hypothetical protein E2562_033504 [Oryza meyeriana var. granulata]